MIATIHFWDVVWEGILVAVATSGITGTVSYVKWIAPRRKEKEEKERQLEIGWFGRPGTPIEPEIIAMPLRVDGMEKGLRQLDDTVHGLKGIVEESNGNSKRTMEIVEELQARVPAVTKAEVVAAIATGVADVATGVAEAAVETAKKEGEHNES